ncbi:MAG TPA: ABC transporter permease/substrate-binding protein [Caulobacteraceae bacterium]|nr:ABC transporter permease/substrate-binding protein [Caulobacteraceae bacterium]
MNAQIAAAWRALPGALAGHVLVSACALALGLALSLPLAVLAARHARVRWPALALASLVQTVPSLALLALFYPLLLALSAALRPLIGVVLPALGFLPALLALTLYSMLPILRTAIAGLTGVDPAVIEAADGVGMTPSQRLWRIEAPLAAPVVMAGVRTAAVWTIGAATLSTTVGQTSLGDYIFAGLQTENWVFVLFGCAASAILALAADQLLGLIEAGAGARDRRRIALGAAGLIAGTLACLAPAAASGLGAAPARYVVGAKNFSEQFTLAALIGDRLKASGAGVSVRQGLGSAVIFRALASGDLDVYVDYSGTLWTNVLGHAGASPPAEMVEDLKQELKARYGVELLGPLGFENAYALAMKGDRARTLGVASIADLAPHAPDLTLGSDLEFLSRPEWASLRGAYGLSFKAQRSFSPTFMYRALQDGEADVVSAFSSDGRIAADGLTVLADPKGALPSYDAVILISPRRVNDARLRQALQPLIGRIDVQAMRQANLMVDRDQDKQTPAQAAAFLESRLR